MHTYIIIIINTDINFQNLSAEVVMMAGKWWNSYSEEKHQPAANFIRGVFNINTFFYRYILFPMHADFLSYTFAYIRPYIQTIKHSLLKILDTDHN